MITAAKFVLTVTTSCPSAGAVKRHHAVCANPPQSGGGSSACNVAPASEVEICDVTPDNTIASSKLSLGGGTDCPLTVAANVTSKIATMRLRAPVGSSEEPR